MWSAVFEDRLLFSHVTSPSCARLKCLFHCLWAVSTLMVKVFIAALCSVGWCASLRTAVSASALSLGSGTISSMYCI